MTRLRTVGEVAALAGTTVRALHHYDEIGLLEPSVRSATGYRLYAETDIVRLHSIIHWRSLGIGLEEIADLIDAPDVDLAVGLKRQLERMRDHAKDLETMIEAVEATIASLEKGDDMTDDAVHSMFNGFDPSRHDEEAEQKWGDTSAYHESQRRVASYNADDWQRFADENGANIEEFVALMRDGVDPGDEAAAEAARTHGELIDRWFYPLQPETHLGLADAYVADPRFESTYEAIAPGLARYISNAIQALHTAD